MEKPVVAAILAFILFAPRIAAADALDEVRKRGELVWGGDQEGGGPLIFPDDKNPDVLKGFEVELAAMIAAELGVKPRFQQNQWQNVPATLNDRRIDVALNGYEATPAFARDYLLCRPYYAYGLQLVARTDARFKSWNDIKQSARPIKIGVLGGSAAETYLKSPELAGKVEVVSYDGNTEPMAGAESGQVDAALQDDCVAIFYADRFPKLAFIDRPVGAGYYVPLVRQGETKLKEAIDAAIEKLIASGKLEQLYDRWKLGGRNQTLLLRRAGEVKPAEKKPFASLLVDNFPILLRAAGVTVFLTLVSMPLAILLGIAVALGRTYGPAPLRWALTVYVEVLRGTPLLLQLWVIYYLIPMLARLVLPADSNVVVPAMVAAIVGLALNYSASESENYRAGLAAIPRGQMEAALALGLTRGQAIRRIILPQAVRIVIPPVTNDFIAMFKDTSVCSVVTVVELTKQYNVLAQSTGAILEMAGLTGLLYMLMSYPLSRLSNWAERTFGKS